MDDVTIDRPFAPEALPHRAVADEVGDPVVRTADGWMLGWPYLAQPRHDQWRLAHLWAAAPELEAVLGAILGTKLFAAVPCENGCELCSELAPLKAAGQAAMLKAAGQEGV